MTNWASRQVYFLRRADGVGPIKIGCSDGPSARAKQLSGDYKTEFVVLASAPGDFTVERNVHHKFTSTADLPNDLPARAYAYGCPKEWFEPTPDLLAFVDLVARTGTIPLAPSERREVVYAHRYLAGETLKAIADDYGITRERVRQVLRQHGYPTNPWDRARFLKKRTSDRPSTEELRSDAA